jgi:hypothetical protein
MVTWKNMSQNEYNKKASVAIKDATPIWKLILDSIAVLAQPNVHLSFSYA